MNDYAVTYAGTRLYGPLGLAATQSRPTYPGRHGPYVAMTRASQHDDLGRSA